MKYIVLALVLGIITIFLWGMSSSRAPAADLVCGPNADVLKGAQERFHEAPMFSGQSVGGEPLVMTMGPDGSWTMFLSRGGNLCAIAAGKLTAAPPATEKPKTSVPMLSPHGLRMVRS